MNRPKPASRASLPHGIPAHIALARQVTPATPAPPSRNSRFLRKVWYTCLLILAGYGALVIMGS